MPIHWVAAWRRNDERHRYRVEYTKQLGGWEGRWYPYSNAADIALSRRLEESQYGLRITITESSPSYPACSTYAENLSICKRSRILESHH
jgi:hypothetical protein